MTKDPTPAEALAAIRESRAAVARRVGGDSRTYDLIYSVLVALMIGVHVFPSPVGVLGSSSGAVVLALLARKKAERTGVYVSEVRPRRARWVAWGLSLILLGIIVAVIWGSHAGLWWLPLPLAVVAFVASLIGLRLWRRVYRAETDTK